MGWFIPQKELDSTSSNYWRADYADGYAKKTWWIALGRTDSPWGDDSNPPDATVGTTLIEVLGYKKVDYRTLVVPDQEDGSLQWRNLRFAPVQSKDRLKKTNGVYPRWLFLRATITTTELPTEVYFRQVAIYTDLEPDPKYDHLEVLTPDQVEDPGNLFYVINIPRQYRLETQIENIAFLFEF